MRPQTKHRYLSYNEHLVVQCLALGMRYADIAHQQRVSLSTIQTYVKRAYSKLKVNSRQEAVYETQLLGDDLRCKN